MEKRFYYLKANHSDANSRVMVPLNPQARGFSLTELLSVVVILGILTFVGIDINLQQRNREEVNALTISLAGWLEQVRKSALLGAGCTVSISSSVSGDALVASATTTNATTQITSPATCLTSNPLRGDDVASISPSSSFSITSPTIQFTPRGTVSPLSNSVINVVVKKLPNGPTRCIAIKGLIGNITISRGDQCGEQERF
ncbi:Tfp pilus assembly protein FimT/FimU [Synechococcus sp. HK05]|uniref:Tfp pilus assembly protein FimT/FimU n=1 Tax=Synechococcus sp. HK05 TaxID=2725975 RepID=UPI0034CED9BB